MRSRFVLFVLLLSVPFITGFGGGWKSLILIENVDARSFIRLNDFDIRPNLKGEGWVLATSAAPEIEDLQREGYRVTIVDEAAWSGFYYMVNRLDGGQVSALPGSFLELTRLPEGMIVKSSEENIDALRR